MALAAQPPAQFAQAVSASTGSAPVADAILAATTDANTRLSMLVGSALEGGWGPNYGVGDAGHSYGPYQINMPYHPEISRAAAIDPTAATAWALPRYQAAVAAISPAQWSANPKGSAELAAYSAEQPAQIYHVARGQGAVDDAYARSVGVLSGTTSTTSPVDLGNVQLAAYVPGTTIHIPGTGPGGSLVPSWADPAAVTGAVGQGLLSVLGAVVAPLKSYLENSVLVVFGLIAVLVGIVIIAHGAMGESGGDGQAQAQAAASSSREPEAAAAE